MEEVEATAIVTRTIDPVEELVAVELITLTDSVLSLRLMTTTQRMPLLRDPKRRRVPSRPR